jgi:hypothetical protein
MKKMFKEFTIEVERNLYTSKTNIKLTNKEEMYKYTLKVGSEKEVINEMIWTIGNEATLEEAKEYFENHKERR